MRLRRVEGFTLIELIAVMVVLSICASIGASFIVDVVDQYQKASLRSSLVMRGTVVMEQMSRKLRLSVPNSVRVSASGLCVEFMPLVAGSVYTQPVADEVNGRLASNSVDTVGFSLLNGSPEYAFVAPMTAAEVYSDATSSNVRAAISSLSGSPVSTIQLASNHRFIRNSVSSRILVADSPERFCIAGGELINYRNYTLSSSAISDGSPGGVTIVMADGVSANTAFVLTAGSENRNAALDIAVEVSGGSETVSLNNRVLIRNVP